MSLRVGVQTEILGTPPRGEPAEIGNRRKETEHAINR